MAVFWPLTGWFSHGNKDSPCTNPRPQTALNSRSTLENHSVIPIKSIGLPPLLGKERSFSDLNGLYVDLRCIYATLLYHCNL